MEIKVTIGDVNFAGTIEEVFKNLTPEQRTDIARDVVTKFLEEPHGAERAAFESSVVDELMRSNLDGTSIHSYRSRPFRDMTRDDVIGTTQYKDRVGKFKSTREKLIETITSDAIAFYREKVDAMVRTDPQLQEVMKVTLEEIRTNFPKYAHDALMAWFISNMQAMGQGMHQALIQAGNADMMTRTIEERLRGRGLL